MNFPARLNGVLRRRGLHDRLRPIGPDRGPQPQPRAYRTCRRTGCCGPTRTGANRGGGYTRTDRRGPAGPGTDNAGVSLQRRRIFDLHLTRKERL